MARSPTATSDGKSYRPALDGLRAIAVLSVLAYHFGYTWLPGGFLGVDVFFVLSGYLITSLLIREYDHTQRIAFAQFWARRVRRLLPALAVLLLGVSAWVYWSAPIETWTARRQDLLWTLFYGANWHFIETSQDYFARYTGASPLLHAWSLAIEEQFYFLWPLIFLVTLRVLRFRRWLMAALFVAAAVASALWMAALYDSAGFSRAYHGTDSRIQQLLIGAALAVVPIWATRRVRPSPWLWWLGPVVALAVAGSMLGLDDRAAFYYRGGAFLFSLIVAGVIWAVEVAPSHWIARALSVRPLRWVGRISYGLYLWHWFVLVAIWDGASSGRLGNAWRVKGLSLTFAAAALSYYLVERPVREGRVAWLRRSPTRLAMVASVVVIVVTVAALRATSVPATLAPDQHLDVDLSVALKDYSDSDCPISAEGDAFSWCVRHEGSIDRPIIATIGDSMARALDPGLEAEAVRRDFTYIQAAWGGCPVSGIGTPQFAPPSMTPDDVECLDKSISTVQSMIDTARPTILVMTEHGSAVSSLLVDDRFVAPLSAEHDQTLIDAYDAVFERFLGSVERIVLIETNHDGLPVGCSGVASTNKASCSQPLATVDAIDRFNLVLDTVAKHFPGRVSVISLADIVCPGGYCVPVRDGMLIRYDGQHYTATFSRWLAPQLVDRIAP